MTASQQNTTSAQSRFKRATRSAFTLIELLVVIALTSVLLTLVFVPLTNSLNLTSRAGTQIETQSAARDIMRQVQAELNGAVFVYDNASQGIDAPGGQGRLGDPDGRIYFWAYGQPASGTNVLTGPAVPMLLRYAMVEFIEPASQSEQSASTTLDPTTGKPIQTPGAPTNMSLPLVPGRTIARYFVGLTNNTSGATGLTDSKGNKLYGMPVDGSGNFHGYANKFDDATNVNLQADNRATLYKAEVQPYISDPFNPGKFIPNIALFHTIGDNGRPGSDPTKPIIVDDPNFFYDNTSVNIKYAIAGAPGINPNDASGKPRTAVPMWECWKAVSQSLLALNKADAITLERDDLNAVVYRDSEGRLPTEAGATAPFNPVVRPLITFTPQYVENDPGVPSSLENAGAESPYSAATQFRSQYGAWSRPFRVVVYRAPDSQNDPLNYVDPGTNKPLTYEMQDPNIGITFQGAGANVGPAPDASGFWTNTNPQYAFTVDYEKGTVNFAFPHWVLDKDGSGNPVPMYYNPNTVNSKIDLLANGDLQYAKRFLWLRNFDTTNANNPAGAISPLQQYDVLNDTPPSFYRVRVVPGSERIFGPDQNPGAHYGYRTQYTRVSANVGNIGHNQYKILYENTANAANTADAADPRVRTGFVEFDSLPDKNDTDINSQNLDPNDDIPMTHPKLDRNGNTIIAPPTYRNHSLPEKKWVPDSANPTDMTKGSLAPADPIEVSYSFQMNRPTDVVKIDYLTRSIMNVNMEMRLYDPRSARPQTTQLVDKVTVRNLPR